MRYCFPQIALALLLHLPSAAALSGEVAQEEQIVITATRLPLLSTSIGTTVTVITAADIAQRGTFFISDILKGVPGLTVEGSGTPGALTSVRIRGAEADHTQVFIDGVEVNDPASNSSFDFGLLSSDNIERIEIMRGAQSALSGSGAIGGVINIITKQGDGPLSIEADLTGGTFGTDKESARIAYRNTLLDYNIHAARLRSSGMNIARTGTEKDGYESDTYAIKLGLRPTDFLAFHINGHRSNSKVESDPQPGPVVLDSANNKSINKREYLSGIMRLSLLEDRWQHTFSILSTKTDSEYLSQQGNFPSKGKKKKYVYQSDIHLTATDATHQHYFSLLFERQDHSTAATSTSIDGWSYAAEHHITLFSRLSITTGIRHDNNTFFKDATTYRVNTSYDWNGSGTRLHFHYGTGSKNPTIAELFGVFEGFLSNPDLKPERSKSWDIGVKQSLLDQRLVFGIVYYQNKIADAIINSRVQNQSTTINQDGTSSIHGIETTADVKINKNIGVFIGYSYTHARDANGQALPRRPQSNATLRVDYSATDRKININLGAYHNGNRKDYVFGLGRVTLPSFTLVNLSARYRVNTMMELYGNIENLFDKRYEEIYSYRAPGRAFFAGIKVYFDLK